MSHNTADAGQDGGKTDDGMQSGDGLGEVRGRDSLADEEAWVVSCVQVIKRRESLPASVPRVARVPNCVSTSGEKPAARRLARTPEPTPSMPSMLPRRAVVCEARPEREPMQRTDEARYPAWTRPAAPVLAAARKPPPKTAAGTAYSQGYSGGSVGPRKSA